MPSAAVQPIELHNASRFATWLPNRRVVRGGFASSAEATGQEKMARAKRGPKGLLGLGGRATRRPDAGMGGG